MSAQPQPYLSAEAYLARERESEQRHEYCAGAIYALAGGSEAHNLILSNMITVLNNRLWDGPCRVYPSDMRVLIPAADLYTYPDIAVVCGAPRFEDEHHDTLLNPLLIVEILSPLTERYDRGRKFHHYMTIATLQEYLLVSQESCRVEQFVRMAQHQWLLTTYSDRGDTLALRSIEARLALAEIYNKVELKPPAPTPSPQHPTPG